ncbi:hypothetical protein M0811_05277 [Anaeramoeba ignava]|uniref:Uncharacterized protein n=1 Tax=Anaeramoeba ignava TaxID=1746090 RepID=A0A9Q0LVF6_ANAIG|nr:hypothetical protein M0811_05277 [Anaeramoeba ignava]
MSSLINQSFTIHYEDEVGHEVNSFTIQVLDNLIIYYQGEIVSNGKQTDISSPSNYGELEFEFIMAKPNTEDDSIIKFNLSLNSNSGYSTIKTMNFYVNNSNLKIGKEEGNLTEDSLSPINLTFSDSYSGNLNTSWQIVWIGDNTSGSTIQFEGQYLYLGAVITSGNGTPINNASPVEIYIQPKQHYTDVLELGFMIQNGIENLNQSLLFNITENSKHHSFSTGVKYETMRFNHFFLISILILFLVNPFFIF